MISAIGNGIIRTIIGNQKLVADVVPVDIVINLLIVTAWRTATLKSNELMVYNCVTRKQNPINWGTFMGTTVKYMIRHPLEGVFWYPTWALRTNRQLNKLLVYMLHYIPAYVIDLFAWASRKKPM